MTKSRKGRNKIDTLIESLGSEFSKIQNFSLTQTDPEGQKLFNLIVSKFADLSDFRALYKQYFIPATNRARVATRKEMNTSYYLKVLDVADIDLNENYHDTIRLGYVGLFHKVENFVKDVLLVSNEIFNDGKKGNDSVEGFFKDKYNFRFNNWYGDLNMRKINWIANCVKHYDGLPLKQPKYEYLSHLSEDEKIKIDQNDFYEDIEYIFTSYYRLKLTQILTLANFKTFIEDIEISELEGDLLSKYNEAEAHMRKIVELGI